MRMEKGCGYWKADFVTDFNRYEAGLERFDPGNPPPRGIAT